MHGFDCRGTSWPAQSPPRTPGSNGMIGIEDVLLISLGQVHVAYVDF